MKDCACGCRVDCSQYDRNERATPNQIFCNLGVERAIGTIQAWDVWGRFEGDYSIRYTLETITECAEENRQGENWHFVPIIGLGHAMMREIRGIGPSEEPHYAFSENFDWFMDHEFAKKNSTPVCVLLNLRHKLLGLSWREQNKSIERMGGKCLRANDALVVEAAVTLYCDRGTKIDSRIFHLGDSISDDGFPVTARFLYDAPGGAMKINIAVCQKNKEDFRNGVILMRSFDF